MSHEIGIDIVEVERIRKSVEKDGERFLKRLFTPWEVDYCSSKADPAQHYAGRFAAKEALVKAFGGNLEKEGWAWTEVEIKNDGKGRPILELHGKAAVRGEELKVTGLKLSLSHTRVHAVAVVLVEVE